MPLPGVYTTKTTGGLGRKSPSKDGTAGLIMQAPVGYGITLNATFKFQSLADAETQGFSDTKDQANDCLCWYHIKEFYRMAGKTATLYVRLVGQAVAMSTFLDNTSTHAPEMLADAEGEIRILAAAMNPDAGYIPTLTSGLDEVVLNSISKAQALADSEFALHRPVQIIIEGRKFNGTASALHDLRTESAKNVSVVLLQDYDVYQRDTTNYDGHAAVGTALGCVARAAVHENIGHVGKFNLQNKATGEFMNCSLSSGALISSISETDLGVIHDKSYIFGLRHEGKAGVYFNFDWTAIDYADDFSNIRNNRAVDKAVREVRIRLLPKVNSPLYVDSAGKLQPAVIKAFETDADSPLNDMAAAGEISDGWSYVDPDQDVLSTDRIEVQITVVPVGTAKEIQVTIGLSNPNAQ